MSFLDSFPKTRADCVGQARPCPWARCRYHLLLDVSPKRVKLRFDLENWEDQEHSCALDAIDAEGAMVLKRISEHTGVSTHEALVHYDDAMFRLPKFGRRSVLAALKESFDDNRLPHHPGQGQNQSEEL